MTLPSPSGTEAIGVEVNSWPLRVVTITTTELNVACSLNTLLYGIILAL